MGMSRLARPMKSVAVHTACPMCHKVGTLTVLSTTIDVPYFGEGLESTLRCDACGFRHADFMILAQKEPWRLEFRAREIDDLSVRVIRSNSGTIRIPELGFTAEPTPLSESYVSNVEGVLDRAKDILLTALSFHGEDPEKAALLHQYLSTWEDCASGREPFTLIIDDPFGNSAIVSERVEKRALTEDEIAQLKTGYIILDKEDLA
jgi:zinc finger protein